ncbi:hypothetical protein DITRI_Ditri20bG0079300 [Diplodiscus trichospermus]
MNCICTLTSASSLLALEINYNNFGVVFPECTGNLSTNLTILLLDNNIISGSIPVGIRNLINLEVLYAWNDQLSGSIPSAIGNLQKLQQLDLGINSISGVTPNSLGNLKMLNILGLNDNNLIGSIPSSLGKKFEKSGSFICFSKSTVWCASKQSPQMCKTRETIDEWQFLPRFHSFKFIERSCSCSFASFKFLQYLDLSYNDFEGMVLTEGVFKNATAKAQYELKSYKSKYCHVVNPLHSATVIFDELLAEYSLGSEVFKEDLNLHNFVKAALPERIPFFFRNKLQEKQFPTILTMRAARDRSLFNL